MQKFDLSKDVKFISYAVWWVRNSMQEFIKKRRACLNTEKEENTLNAPLISNGIPDSEDEWFERRDVVLSNEEDETKKELHKNQRRIIDKLLSMQICI